MIKIYCSYSDDCESDAVYAVSVLQQAGFEAICNDNAEINSCAIILAFISDNTDWDALQRDLNFAIAKRKPIRYIKLTKDESIDSEIQQLLDYGKEVDDIDSFAAQVGQAFKTGMKKTLPILIGIACIVILLITQLAKLF